MMTAEMRINMEGLRDALIQQYMLHEAPHHDRLAGEGGEPARIAPMAHTLTDIYKCLHQAEFGIGHSIENPDHFRDQLYREFERAEPWAREPLLETIDTEGAVFRVNMRPYKALFAQDQETGRRRLLHVCMDSEQHRKGVSDRFLMSLDGFKKLNAAGELAIGRNVFAFAEAAVDRFFLELRSLFRRVGGVPVFSHSPIYRQFNAPSYRVVERDVLMNSPLAEIIRTDDAGV